ncbi:hypothetical protein [Hippea alviniae]|uniref:hypothetical protein n=1 Tax=Hippea alviniae TaxID=1279027 RepID=UPI0003B60A7D|nr:hypothetical protein [Hippea alviniae]
MFKMDLKVIKDNYCKLLGNSVVLKLKASEDVGLGHLSRMITLASFIKEEQRDVLFAINDFDYAKKRLKDEGFEFEVNRFDNDERFVDYLIEKYKPNTLVIDEKQCYSKSSLLKWQKSTKIVIIDHVCENYRVVDKIIVPNAHFQPKKYAGFKNIEWGWNWVLINREILKLKPKEKLPEKINKIVITTGGSDPKGMLFDIIDKIKNTDKEVLILIGDSFKHRERLEKLDLPENFKIEPYHPTKLLKGDVAIATFGVSVYELIYLNVPVYCVGHTKENEEGCRVLAKRCEMVREFLKWYRKI